MAAPVFESIESEVFGSFKTSTSVSLPSGTQAGDLLLLVYSQSNSSDISLPNGFKRISSMRGYASVIASKIADGTESSTLTVTNSNGIAAFTHLSVMRFSGVDQLAPVYDIVTEYFSSNSHSTPASVATGDQTVVRLVQVRDDVSSFVTTDSGVVPLVNDEKNTTNDSTLLIGYDSSTYQSGDTIPSQGFTCTKTDNRSVQTLVLTGTSTVEAATPIVESYTEIDHTFGGGGEGAPETLSITPPSGTSEGDVLIAMFITEDTISSTSLAGFTSSEILNGAISLANNTTRSIYLGYRIVTASEPATYDITSSMSPLSISDFNTADGVIGYILRVSGADTTTPISGFAFDEINNIAPNYNLDFKYPSVSAPTNSLIIRAFGDGDDRAFGSPVATTSTVSCTGDEFPIVINRSPNDKSFYMYTEEYAGKSGTQPSRGDYLTQDGTATQKVPFSVSIQPLSATTTTTEAPTTTTTTTEPPTTVPPSQSNGKTMSLSTQSCMTYSQVSSDCSCLLIIQDQHGRKKRINLKDAITIEYPSHFVIQTPITGAKIHPDSTFTQDDIDALICSCAGSGGASPSISTEVPRSVVLSGAQTFSLPANTTVLAYALIASGSVGVTPTITTAEGTRAIEADETGSFGSGNSTLSGTLDFTLSAGDKVLIQYTTTS